MATEELCSVEIVGMYYRMLFTVADTYFWIAVTHNVYPDRQFEIGGQYSLRYRKPSSPKVPTGISLDTDGVHYGWIREGCNYPPAGYFFGCTG
jgi:hypothetical protein